MSMIIIYAWLVLLTIFCVVLLKLQLLAKDILEDLLKLQKNNINNYCKHS